VADRPQIPQRIRKRADGRRAVLGMIDWLIAREDNLRKLAQACQAELNARPMEFLKEIVIPLTPQSMREDAQSQGSPEDRARQIQDALRRIDQATQDLKALGAAPSVGSTERTQSP